jgi:hypothetical protein
VGGSAYSTAEDMGKYIHAFLDPEGRSGGVLSSEMVDEMLRPVYRKDPFLPAQALRYVVDVCVEVETSDPIIWTTSVKEGWQQRTLET